MRQAHSFIVRVYGRKGRGQLQGTVEAVSSGERFSFSTPEQLWMIVCEGSGRAIPRNRTTGK